jgi:branched-chain amino acid aminotransferase
MQKGVRMKVSSWQRHSPNAMPPAAKGTGMYINSSMAKVEALNAGYDEADPPLATGLRERVHRREPLRRQQRRAAHAAGRPAGALEGITQGQRHDDRARLRIRGPLGNILRSDLYTCDEAFLTGNRAEVVPIRSVDDREIGEPGPITRKIQETYAPPCAGRSRAIGMARTCLTQ